MDIKINHIEFENIAIETKEISGAAFVLGEALYEAGDTIRAEAAFAIARHLGHVHDKIYNTIREHREAE